MGVSAVKVKTTIFYIINFQLLEKHHRTNFIKHKKSGIFHLKLYRRKAGSFLKRSPSPLGEGLG